MENRKYYFSMIDQFKIYRKYHIQINGIILSKYKRKYKTIHCKHFDMMIYGMIQTK